MLSLKVRHLVKHHSIGLQRFSHENATCFAESQRVGKKPRNTFPAQIQMQTIKVWHFSYQNAAQPIFNLCCVLFDVYHNTHNIQYIITTSLCFNILELLISINIGK